MEYEVKKEIEITLKLSQEEFNTLVSGLGTSSHVDRKIVARNSGLSILKSEDDEEFYSKIKQIAMELS